MTFEQYIEDHSSSQMRAYLTGYADAIHNNAYFFGGCPKRLQYRPYSEYMQHIDIYIAQKTADKSANKEVFLRKNIEPFLTEVILKYIDCNNPEAIQLDDEIKVVQLEVRDVAREILFKTKKYQSIDEREMEFQYAQYLKRLKNPTPKEKEASKVHGVHTKKANVSKPIAEKLKEQAEAEHAKAKIVDENEEKDSGGGIFSSIKNKITDFLPDKKVDVKPDIAKSDSKPDAKTSDDKVVKSGEVEKQDSKTPTTPTTSAPNSTATQNAKQNATITQTPTQPTVINTKGFDMSVPELKITPPQDKPTIQTTKGKKKNAKTAEKTATTEELPIVSEDNYKLDSMDINLDNLTNAKIPSM